jgi:hypothetical protein
MPDFLPASAVAMVTLVAVHVWAGRLRFIDVIPRSRFLSVAGGMSVAYVFLRILPELGRTQLRVGAEVGDALNVPRHPIYLVALTGLVVFYGLERWASASREEHRAQTGEDCPTPVVFWVSIASYAIVNFAVGYLLVDLEPFGMQRLSLFFLAMALWFVVNDYGLRTDHRDRYRRVGRWLLALAVAIGWVAGIGRVIPETTVSLALAFVAGGIVLNVLKEELPEERESRFWAFALGAGLYSALLLTI